MKLLTAHKNNIKSSEKGLALRNSKGFTLIELLVVIGILGVLAAALIATIDPFEQLKKANDSNVKNTAVEFINANVRYYTTHSAMPWSDSANTTYSQPCSSQVTWNGTSFATANLGVATGCLQSLVNDGEIKAGFTTVANVLSSVIVSGSTNGVTACFKPQSKAQINDLNTKYNVDGSLATAGCPGGTACYWCSQ